MKVVARDGGAQRARECLEYRLDLVVFVLPFGLDVQVAAGRFGEALEDISVGTSPTYSREKRAFQISSMRPPKSSSTAARHSSIGRQKP